MTQRLQPLTDEELGEYKDKLGGRKVYGIIRREDIGEEILANMRISPEARELRLRKSRRWMLPQGFPQLGWRWEAIIDFGPFKSEWNGKHDLPGGTKCFICHTWCRYGHVLSHPEWDVEIIVGCDCAAMLGDTDPTWTEKKLQAIVEERQQRLLWEEQERLREEEERQQCLLEAEEARQRREQQFAVEKKEAERTAAEILRLYALPESAGPIQQIDGWYQRWQRWIEYVQDKIKRNLYFHLMPGGFTPDGNLWRYSQADNPTFKTSFCGIPFGGTVYPKNGRWCYILNLPQITVHSPGSYATEDDAMDDVWEHCEVELLRLVETLHVRETYAPVNCRESTYGP